MTLLLNGLPDAPENLSKDAGLILWLCIPAFCILGTVIAVMWRAMTKDRAKESSRTERFIETTAGFQGALDRNTATMARVEGIQNRILDAVNDRRR